MERAWDQRGGLRRLTWYSELTSLRTAPVRVEKSATRGIWSMSSTNVWKVTNRMMTCHIYGYIK